MRTDHRVPLDAPLADGLRYGPLTPSSERMRELSRLDRLDLITEYLRVCDRHGDASPYLATAADGMSNERLICSVLDEEFGRRPLPPRQRASRVAVVRERVPGKRSPW